MLSTPERETTSFWETGLTGSGRIVEIFGREWMPFDELKTRIAYGLVGTRVEMLFETQYEKSFGSAQAVYGCHLPYGQQKELFRVIWDGRDGWATLQFQGQDGALKTTDPLWTYPQLKMPREPEKLMAILDQILKGSERR
ncbi:MAG: hypothetical protein J5I90_21395 [Caldilineales bacterium]|nr:hypothetical protein [Caldilineales bacterium]